MSFLSLIPLPWRIGGGLFLLAALLTWGWQIKKGWEERAVDRERANTVIEREPVIAEQEKADRKEIEASREREAALIAALGKVTDTLNAVQAEKRQIAAQRIQEQSRISALPDSAIVPEIRAVLAVTPLDTSANLNPTELREARKRLSDLATLTKDQQATAREVQTLGEKISNLESRLTETQGRERRALERGDRLLGAYREAFDAVPKRKRKWYCVWLCSTEKKLGIPTPEELLVNPI